MGRICKANQGLGGGFIDEGGSAMIRVGKGETMPGASLTDGRFVDESGSAACREVLGASSVLTGGGGGGCSSGGWLTDDPAVRIDTGDGGELQRGGEVGAGTGEAARVG
jgi:hypothetical protein